MIVERFFSNKKNNEFSSDIDVCDDVVSLIKEIWLKDIKHGIEYKYFKDVNNTIIKIYLYDNIGNFKSTNLGIGMNDNIDIFIDFVTFFKDKVDVALRATSNSHMQAHLIFWNNIDEIKNQLSMRVESKNYNL